MKKIVNIVMMILMLLGCTNSSVHLNIPKLTDISKYSEKELEDKLIGIAQEELIVAWNEPDGMCSGMWCDIWKVDDENIKNIFIYYDANGKVERTLIDEIQDPDVDKKAAIKECWPGEIIDIFTEGNGVDLKEIIQLEIKDHEEMYFTLVEDTEYL